MKPSEACKLIRDEHDELEAFADELEARITSPDADVLGIEMRARVKHFASKLSRHIDHEERFLVPHLRSSTNWGAINEAELRAHHAAQRKELDGLYDQFAAEDVTPGDMIGRVVAMLADVRQDIADENEHFVNHMMLHDLPESDGEAG